jgi:hypothetical protein
VKPTARCPCFLLIAELIERGFQLAAVGLIEVFVGIEPEDPVAGGVAEGFDPGRGEVIDPGEVEDAGAQGGGELFGAVGRAGIDNDDLKKRPATDCRQADKAASPFCPIKQRETRADIDQPPNQHLAERGTSQRAASGQLDSVKSTYEASGSSRHPLRFRPLLG